MDVNRIMTARRVRAALIGAWWALTLTPACVRAAEDYSEDAVKAAFLYRFAGYVTWPQELGPNAPFTIAVLGTDGTVAALERLLPNHPIRNHPARVRPIQGIQDLGDAQMLYVVPGHPVQARKVIEALLGKPVLVVTDEEGGLEEGGMVNFLLVDRRVRFEISLSATEDHRLKVSSELLSVAARVQGGHLRSDASCGPAAFGDRVGSACPPRVAGWVVGEGAMSRQSTSRYDGSTT